MVTNGLSNVYNVQKFTYRLHIFYIVCGIAKKGTKIVGGEQTDANEYPWIASMQARKQFYVVQLAVLGAQHSGHIG